MVARQVDDEEMLAAIQAEVGIAPEQRVVVQRRRIGVARRIGGAMPECRDDARHLDDGARPGVRVDSAAQPEQRPAALIGDLRRVVEAHRAPVIHPLERHAGDVGAQDKLAQGHAHG